MTKAFILNLFYQNVLSTDTKLISYIQIHILNQTRFLTQNILMHRQTIKKAKKDKTM